MRIMKYRNIVALQHLFVESNGKMRRAHFMRMVKCRNILALQKFCTEKDFRDDLLRMMKMEKSSIRRNFSFARLSDTKLNKTPHAIANKGRLMQFGDPFLMGFNNKIKLSTTTHARKRNQGGAYAISRPFSFESEQ